MIFRCQPDTTLSSPEFFVEAPNLAEAEDLADAVHNHHDYGAEVTVTPAPGVRRKYPGMRQCGLDHGGETNAATVYGHFGSPRNCLRMRDTDVWVYDPAWEEKR